MSSIENMFDLSDRAALVTGGSRGLGLAMAEGLVEAGGRVVLADVNDTGEAEEKLRDRGGEVVGLQADVSRMEDVRKAVGTARDRWGSLDVLVNNAGIFRSAPGEDTEVEDWENVLDVNLTGQFRCARTAGRHMIENGGGSIINIASVAGLRAFQEAGAYNASKGGVVMLTRTLAAEWGKHGVRVNAICPGAFETAMTEDLREDESFNEMIRNRVPLGRVAEPEELAGAAVYLASDASSYVTGETLVVDGGWTAGL